MKKILLAAVAALALSGCILDDDFWEDGYDSTYDSPSGDDCDCDDGDYFSQPAYHAPDQTALRVSPRPH
jgi:hypothetical protein